MKAEPQKESEPVPIQTHRTATADGSGHLCNAAIDKEKCTELKSRPNHALASIKPENE